MMFGKGRANVPCSAQLERKITPPTANHETRLLYVSDALTSYLSEFGYV